MRRREFLAGLAFAAACLADAPGKAVRGRLVQEKGKPPMLELTAGRRVILDGDDATKLVLNDERLKDSDFEAIGHYTSADHFLIDGIHLTAMYVHKNGERLMITYWCDVCYIRTYAPGNCWCCQKYTDLDLRESVGQ